MPTKINGFSMKFQKGHKLAKGGARPGAGRKSNQVKADEARASEIVKGIMARGIGSILAVADKLCKGIKRKKFYPQYVFEQLLKDNPKAQKFYYEIEYDSAMIRFWIERFVPGARQGIDIAVGSPEEFYRALAAAERDEAEEKRVIETKGIPEPESDQRH